MLTYLLYLVCRMIKKPMRKKIVYCLSVIFLLLGACSPKQREGTIKEGVVEYKVTYLENKMTTPIPTHLLPSKLILKFTQDKSSMSIEGFMGVFSLKIITDHRKNSTVTIMKIMEKKLYHQGKPDDGIFLFRPIEGMKVELRTGQKEIAGLKCKRGRVIFPNSDIEQPFIFYYTEDILIKNPNEGNPYKSVDGVLMKFQMQMNKLRMDLSAIDAKPKEIDDSEFDVPKGYRHISKEDMIDILDTFMK